MHSPTSHMAPHLCRFPYVSRKGRFMDREPVYHIETIGPSTRRFAVDFTSCYKFWTNYTHLICRNFICQPSAIAETRVKQRVFAFKSCCFVRHPAGISWLLCYFQRGKTRHGRLGVCFTSLTSFVDKRLLTNRPCHRCPGSVNGSRRFRDRLTLPILHKLT